MNSLRQISTEEVPQNEVLQILLSRLPRLANRERALTEPQNQERVTMLERLANVKSASTEPQNQERVTMLERLANVRSRSTESRGLFGRLPEPIKPQNQESRNPFRRSANKRNESIKPQNATVLGRLANNINAVDRALSSVRRQ